MSSQILLFTQVLIGSMLKAFQYLKALGHPNLWHLSQCMFLHSCAAVHNTHLPYNPLVSSVGQCKTVDPGWGLVSQAGQCR